MQRARNNQPVTLCRPVLRGQDDGLDARQVQGGLTYALMHLVEGWSSFRTPHDMALSVIFVFVSYTGPGMFKSFVTLRTGNAWVHAISYHAIAPHVIVDAPLVAKIFRLG